MDEAHTVSARPTQDIQGLHCRQPKLIPNFDDESHKDGTAYNNRFPEAKCRPLQHRRRALQYDSNARVN